MIQLLEQLLFEKTKGSQSDILYAQWSYDKKVIPTALQAISNIFPHYSLHDESHSITILNNIVRILGIENLQKFSAIDIWLLLEAAYSHDLGMVVSGDDLIKTFSSDKFIDFFRDLKEDKRNSLNEFAEQFDIADGVIKYKNAVIDLALIDSMRFIIAEYFRKNHAERSEIIINDPNEHLSLRSPRGVIPPRIFKMLGNISSCHTKDFENVIQLPFCEVGIDIEDAHPRFIACLLRLGDLLDLDNNRFSEVMLRTLTKVPLDTLRHKSKHLSIEKYRLDRKVIEITAKCDDYETASITQHWFNYLNQEISQQMTNWNIIVPTIEMGFLPTIGKLNVDLANYDQIDGKSKPQFTIDTEKALNLLQGAGIYDGDYQCIREILQNALDATLIRIWVEHGESSDFETPRTTDFDSLKNSYPIKIDIKEIGIKDGWKSWEILISDAGIGISEKDLKFLMSTGSSYRNKEKRSIVNSMPTWMKPSGTFGIGFQSIFMLTSVVNIETKSYFSEELRLVELNSPTSRKNGDILVQKKMSSHKIKPGTKIKITYNTKALPSGYSIKNAHETAKSIVRDYDPFTHKSMDHELGSILDEIKAFASKSYLPVLLTLDTIPIETKNDENIFEFFHPKTSLELTFHYETKERTYNTRTYYKNQIAENNLHLMFLGFEINIHKDNAADVLTLNRNKIKSDYSSILYNDLMIAAFDIITNEFEEIFITDEGKSIGSMFLHYYNRFLPEKKYLLDKFEHWKSLVIKVGKQNMTMIEILERMKTLVLKYESKITIYADRDVFKFNDDELEITLNGHSPSYDFTRFFFYKAAEKLCSIESITKIEKGKIVVFGMNSLDPALKINIVDILKALRVDSYNSARIIIPCKKEFEKLRLKENASIEYVYHILLDSNVRLRLPKMLCPYVRVKENNESAKLVIATPDGFFEWVYKNRYDLNVTKQQIIEEYNRFSQLINLEELNIEGVEENHYY